jgi:hypothetical protein
LGYFLRQNGQKIFLVREFPSKIVVKIVGFLTSGRVLRWPLSMANNYPGSIKSVMKFRPKKNRKIN